MEVIQNILVNYWKLIVYGLLIIISFILLLVRKKPVTDIWSDIFVYACAATIVVENSGVIGPVEKLNQAVAYVCQRLSEKYPNLKPLSYHKEIVKTIEALLATPHKHGDK